MWPIMKKNAIIHIVILRRINSNYERLFEKYNISFEVYNCKMNNDYDSVFNNKTELTCEIKYNNKSYSATLYDNKLELIDSYIGGKDEK